MSLLRLSLLLIVFLLPTLPACNPIEREAALIALRNYGSHTRSTSIYCTTTYAKRSSITNCF
jgi:hypothetical protein